MTTPYPIVADSYGPSHPGAFQAAGIVGAVRYAPGVLRDVDPAKVLTQAELEAADALGFGMAVCGERGTQDWRRGFVGGSFDGDDYRRGLRAIGWPDTAMIYATADTDVGPGDLGVLEQYVQGFNHGAEQLNDRGGLYADGLALATLHHAGVIGYPWQTESNGFHGSATVYVGCVLHQRTTHLLPVTGIDENDVLAADWGQHNHPAPSPAPVPQRHEMRYFFKITDGPVGVVSPATVWMGDGFQARPLTPAEEARYALIGAEQGYPPGALNPNNVPEIPWDEAQRMRLPGR